jgi:ribosomal protein S18 acetylase RimI-like enzyme
LTDNLQIRAARIGDAAAIAALILEGFGQDYGGKLLTPAGRRMMERIHALPGRLTGVFVLCPEGGSPVAMAGLRTREVGAQIGWAEEQITMEEFGIGAALWLELRASLSEPPIYMVRSDEGFIYNVVVTASWRGKGIGDRLLAYLHTEAERRGKRRVLLEVTATNTHAIRLYQRNGYGIVKTRRGLLAMFRIGVPPRLLMAKTLRA